MKQDYHNQILVMVVLMSLAVVVSIVFTPKYTASFQEAKMESLPQQGNVKILKEPVVIRQSLGFFYVTAYCHRECCCGDYADGVTASGHVIQDGDKFCAADLMIPFYKELDIEGYGFVPVLDRGGLIKGNKIDVYIADHDEALEWGCQYIEVFCWVQK